MAKRKSDKAQLYAIAKKVVEQLKANDISILRYNAASNSIYLKLDCGVLGSIRIANHLSKKTHLRYKYNLVLGGMCYTEQVKGVTKRYYNEHHLDEMLAQIMQDYRDLQKKYGPYKYLEYINQRRNQHLNDTKGFWHDAFEA